MPCVNENNSLFLINEKFLKTPKSEDMRRLPIFFLVDVSESMVGEPIAQMEQGMRIIVQELRTDPYALETAYLSVIAFAGKPKTLMPLTELIQFYPPAFPIGGGTSLGKALDYLMDEWDRTVQTTTFSVKGDWKPIIFLFTDGAPTDDTKAALERWNRKYRGHCTLIAIAIGDNVDLRVLSLFTDNVLNLKTTDAESFSRFFRWVSASIKTTSESVSMMNSDEVKLAPMNGINLEKVETGSVNVTDKVDENYAVFLGKCQSTKKSYLLKYAKRLRLLDMGGEYFNQQVAEYRLLGGYPINGAEYESLSDKMSNKTISTENLVGVPTCPCCGNQYGFVICQCGHIFCVGDDVENECPWCGMRGSLGDAGGSINVNRTIG